MSPTACSTTGRQEIGCRDVTNEYTRTPCVVRGTLPAWLLATEGSLYRQSGGAFIPGHAEPFFDGLAHLSCFAFSEGGPFYSNRFVHQQSHSRWRESGERTWGGTAVSVDGASGGGAISSLLGWVASKLGLGKTPDPLLYTNFNPNVNVWRLDGDVVAAATENGGIVALVDPRSLAPLGEVDLLKGSGAITTPAHFLESDDGAYHVALTMKMQMGFPPSFDFRLGIFRGNGGKALELVHSRSLSHFSYTQRAAQPVEARPSYMHSVAQTGKYLVVLVGRDRLAYERLLANDFSRGFFGLFDAADVPLEFWVYAIGADGNVSHRCDCVEVGGPGPSLIWHVGNAFDDPQHAGRIVIDASVTDGLGGTVSSSLSRFTLDLEGGTARRSPPLLGGDAEFLNINPRFLRKEHRWVYALAGAVYASGSSLVKIDAPASSATGVCDGGAVARWGPHDGQIPSEPLFVPRPGGASEDAGVVLSVVVDKSAAAGVDGASYLLVLDAGTMEEIARVDAPHVVNFGLHSHWFQPGLLSRI
mmetsp:Transcript_89617/g.131148  ORF Transcript_89617/g.131148 Transcript_89617/m.131148 type:complete len:530 (+) Transcript_89617:88-1677(+)